jgi:hypothetical protein
VKKNERDGGTGNRAFAFDAVVRAALGRYPFCRGAGEGAAASCLFKSERLGVDPHLFPEDGLGDMDTVAFINATSTRKRDLILSFAIHDEKWPAGIRSLILLRSPAQEWVFEDHERGIAVSMEGADEDEKDLESHLLTEFVFDAEVQRVTVKTPQHSYELDLHKVKPEELDVMKSSLTKMNFDSRTTVIGF